MIQTVSQFLAQLVAEEAKTLGASDITHGPTIGDMYEGLTANVLERAVPPQLGLQVVDGFAIDGKGKRSGQIDCMLVRGEGTPVPYTNTFEWHVKDVVAVFEVKKTLLAHQLRDALQHMRGVMEVHHTWLQSGGAGGEGLLALAEFAAADYSDITHRIAPDPDEVGSWPFEDQALYHTIMSEHYGPIRVVIGYDGYQTEFGFREGLTDILSDLVGKKGSGPASLPELIISGGYSLAKAVGAPYAIPMHGDFWDFYFSSPSNPLTLLLEFIWTRLDRMFGIAGLWGDDLVGEIAHPFLAARPAPNPNGSGYGWELQYRDLTKAQLLANAEPTEWEPARLTKTEALVLQMLIAGEIASLNDAQLLELLVAHEVSVEAIRAGLDRTNLVAFDGDRIEIIADKLAIASLPDKRVVAADDRTGRLTRWVEHWMVEYKAAGEKEG